ncbi:MAG: 7-cyano-7-deazaguanine synthase QueC [bacterium]
MKSAVVLLSGGMDSATLLHYVKQRLKVRSLFALSFSYGQKHSRELAMAKRQATAAEASEHSIVDIRFIRNLIAGSSALTDDAIAVPDLASLSPAERKQPSTYVPHRNLVLLGIAAAYAEAHGCADVFYGAHTQDAYGYWDCTQEFVDNLNTVLALNRRLPVVIRAPFTEMSKTEILRIGLRLDVNYANTWSCYRGGRKPCGSCPTCVERATAFQTLGVKDPAR